MWTDLTRAQHCRTGERYASDLTDAERAVLAPLIVPWVALHYSWRVAFLVTGFFSMAWIFWWYRNYRKPADHPTLTGEELRHIYEEAAVQMGPKVPWLRLLGYRQRLARILVRG